MVDVNVWVLCPKCHQRSGTRMPITVNPPNIYYECEQCGHVWMVAPPRSPEKTSGPLSKNRNDDFS